MAGDIAWALRQSNADGRMLSHARLDLQLDVQRWTPERFAVHGREMSSASLSQSQMLQEGTTYLADRLYAHYGFVNKILAAGAHVVTRVKRDLPVLTWQPRPLNGKDVEAGGSVRRDCHAGHGQAQPPQEQRIAP